MSSTPALSRSPSHVLYTLAPAQDEEPWTITFKVIYRCPELSDAAKICWLGLAGLVKSFAAVPIVTVPAATLARELGWVSKQTGKVQGSHRMKVRKALRELAKQGLVTVLRKGREVTDSLWRGRGPLTYILHKINESPLVRLIPDGDTPRLESVSNPAPRTGAISNSKMAAIAATNSPKMAAIAATNSPKMAAIAATRKKRDLTRESGKTVARARERTIQTADAIAAVLVGGE